LLGAYGANEDESWKEFLDIYGELQDGISRLIINHSDNLDSTTFWFLSINPLTIFLYFFL